MGIINISRNPDIVSHMEVIQHTVQRGSPFHILKGGFGFIKIQVHNPDNPNEKIRIPGFQNGWYSEIDLTPVGNVILIPVDTTIKVDIEFKRGNNATLFITYVYFIDSMSEFLQNINN